MLKSGQGIISSYDEKLFVGSVEVNDESVLFYVTGFCGRSRRLPMVGRKVGIAYNDDLIDGKLWAVSVTEIEQTA